MNRVRCLILLLLITVTAMSQEKGSYMTVSGGIGFQGFKYSPKGLIFDGYNNLQLGWNSGIGYSYFFTKHFGFSVGAGMSYFHSSGGYNVKFDKYQYYDLGMQIDDDFFSNNPNMPFELRARLQDWKEIQTGYTFDIPLMFLFQNKFGIKNKHGIYIGLGAKIQIPFISTRFEVVDSKYADQGRLNISGYYPDWHMEVAAGGTQDPQVPQHGYGTIHNPNEALGWNGNARVKTSYSAVAEIGFLYTITSRVDFMYGFYFDYGLNNIKADDQDSPLMQVNNPYHKGYTQGERYVGKGIIYNGLMNSDRTDHINLVSCGAKVGLRIRLGKIEPIPYSQKYDTQIQPCDTVFIIDTIYIKDTVYKKIVDTIYVNKLNDIKYKPLDSLFIEDIDIYNLRIFFDLDKSIIKPSEAIKLDSLIIYMKRHPEFYVKIIGNTCTYANYDYNVRLGLRRAKAAREYLVKHGISSNRLSVSTRSYTDPYKPNDIEENRSQNRRCEFEIIR